jgi:hypothetical protein
LCNECCRVCSIKALIFKGERLWDDYIKFRKLGICMAMQKKPWMIYFLLVYFFKKCFLGRTSFNNRHLLVLDGHDSHVNFKTMITRNGLKHEHLTIPHITCFPTIRYIFCFKPLETTFRMVRNVAMIRNNHTEPNKITLVGCVD